MVGLLIFGYLAAGGQTYKAYRDSAEGYRGKKDFQTAFRFFSKGIELAKGWPYHDDLLEAAELGCLSGRPDTALFYLKWLADVGEYDMIIYDARADPDLKVLQSDGRWWNLFRQASDRKNQEQLRDNASIAACVAFADSLKAWSAAAFNKIINIHGTDIDLYRRLRAFDQYPNIRRSSDTDLQVFPVKVNDSTYSFYQVQLPQGYRPSQSYTVLFDLHGAVASNAGFPTPYGARKYGEEIKRGMNRFFSEYGYKENVIVVYPNGNKEFNWMYPDDGFGMIPAIARDLKQFFNIDDNRVFVSGHSNGATGVISYLLKDASAFGGYYGFNSNPRVRTGGTFIQNAVNRSYFNVSTDKDYYFPISGHDTLLRIARSMGIDWQNHVYKGFPHWFPEFSESEPAFQLMFADMKSRKRNPFQAKLFWECDDVRYGRCDWISIDELDTAAARKDWQKEFNFSVTHWINNRDTSKVSDTVIRAFDFPRRSGAVRGKYEENVFSIEGSRVAVVTLYLSPEMVDLSKNIVVFANGKKVFDKMVAIDRDFMIAGFEGEWDRKAIWVNAIRIRVP
jgi:predicted esterase